MKPILSRCLLLAASTAVACTGSGSVGDDAAPLAGRASGAVAQRGATTPHDGYTLFQPLRSRNVYLVDMDGELAHRWETQYNPAHSVYLLANGNLLRTGREPDPDGPFRGGGEGGIIQEIAWDGTVVWDYRFSDRQRRQHHDIEPMPDGNVLIIAWESRSYEQAVAAGINPARMREDAIWPDFIVEVEPVHPDDGKIVWEWHAWDHLVQELYRDKDNYGIVAEHPELIDINAAAAHRARRDLAAPKSIESLRALGYIASDAPGDTRPDIERDWIHLNAVDYNPELDQILLTSRNFSEIWVIDHTTSTEEAAGHSGGRFGRGGDLLYRWGNPAAWGAGGHGERALFGPHDARWIEPQLPGAGNILIFNNGEGRPGLDYSSVLEVSPPVTSDGRYLMEPAIPTTAEPVWEYVAPDPQSLYSALLSGAQRLPNGNTLIAAGQSGEVLEVGADDVVVWHFTNPFLEDLDPLTSDRIRRIFGPPAGPSDRADAPPRGPAGGPRRGPPSAGPERGARRGPPPAGPARGAQRGSIYRATRIPADHPGLTRLRANGSGR